MTTKREAAIYRAVAAYRKDLDTQAFTPANQAMQVAYLASLRSLEGQILGITARIEEARASGTKTSPSWLYREARYRALIESVQSELSRFADRAGVAIGQGQRAAVNLTLQNVNDRLLAALGTPPEGVRPEVLLATPTERLTDLVGFLSDGSPLSKLLDKIGPQAARDVGQALTTGLVRGINPNDIARDIRRATGISRFRSESIARTEIHRAAREATRRRFEDNADIVAGWIWHSAHNRSTCAACWAMHGTFHPVTQRLEGHVRCRCAMIPQTKTWAELGYGDDIEETRVTVPLGSDLFAKLSAADQKAILGPTKFAMYASGDFVLSDFAHRDESKTWGGAWREASIAQAILAAEAREKAAAAKPPRAPRKPKAPKDQEAAPLRGFKSGAEVRAEIEAHAAEVGKRLEALIREERELTTKFRDAATDYHAARSAGGASLEQERAYTRAKQDVNGVRAELTTLQNGANTEIHKRFLYAESPSDFKVTGAPRKPSDRSTFKAAQRYERWHDGIEFIRNVVGTGHVDGLSLDYYAMNAGQRAFYLNGRVHIAEQNRAGVVAHEVGHWVEEQSPGSPGLHDIIQLHYKNRTAGETEQKLKDLTGANYRDDETTKRDKWINVYSGKDYTRHGSKNSEIVSMTLEQLFDDPLGMIRNDPETFDVLWNALRLRNTPPKRRRARP